MFVLFFKLPVKVSVEDVQDEGRGAAGVLSAWSHSAPLSQ